MYQIRNSIFETNSSSTHVLSVTNRIPENLPNKIKLHNGYQFGWENKTYYDTESKLAYLYIIADDDQVQTIKALLSALNVEIDDEEFFNIGEGYDHWDEQSYIDHTTEARDFLINLLKQPDMLFAFLFNENSFIETGNDNSAEIYDKYSDEDEDMYGINTQLVPGDYVYIKGN